MTLDGEGVILQNIRNHSLRDTVSAVRTHDALQHHCENFTSPKKKKTERGSDDGVVH
jgi:hypothetical protein